MSKGFLFCSSAVQCAVSGRQYTSTPSCIIYNLSAPFRYRCLEPAWYVQVAPGLHQRRPLPHYERTPSWPSTKHIWYVFVFFGLTLLINGAAWAIIAAIWHIFSFLTLLSSLCLLCYIRCRRSILHPCNHLIFDWFLICIKKFAFKFVIPSLDCTSRLARALWIEILFYPMPTSCCSCRGSRESCGLKSFNILFSTYHPEVEARESLADQKIPVSP